MKPHTSAACCAVAKVRVMLRDWYGPAIGQRTTHAWEGYAARIFLEFGTLHPSKTVRRDGTRGNPKGDFTLTNMDSSSGWRLALNGHDVSASRMHWRLRERRLRTLIGRRLQRLEVDAGSRSTRLTFAHGLQLTTWSYSGCREPHWLLCSKNDGSTDWKFVRLPGTESAWGEVEHCRGPFS